MLILIRYPRILLVPSIPETSCIVTMFSDAMISHIDLITQRVLLAKQEHFVLLHMLMALTVVWAVWRCWRFTVYPMLHPDEPKELPYLIPCRCSHRPVIGISR